MDTIALNLARIRERTRAHPELMRAHHFLYGLRLNPRAGTVECIVMGINPGETSQDWELAPKPDDGMPLEETSESDFHKDLGLTVSARKWRRLCKDIPGTDRVALAECLFWSSPRVADIRQRYGPLSASNPHVQFCTELNRDLIGQLNPRVILVSGLGAISLMTRLYDLHRAGDVVVNQRGRRLIVPYRDHIRPWLFTKHWSGSWMSNDEKARIRAVVASASMKDTDLKLPNTHDEESDRAARFD
jgi:hypothetical protein